MEVSLRFKPVRCATLGEPQIRSPLRRSRVPGDGCPFKSDDQWVPHDAVLTLGPEGPAEQYLFEHAGPRDRIFFDPQKTTAAVVTCGGLCPGLNDVIRSLFFELHFNYGIQRVWGIRNGFLGLNPERGPKPIELTTDFVADIHWQGGTALGTSRGPQEVSMMVDTLQSLGVNLFFCVGGDGTQRGAHAIGEEIARRRLPMSVIGIPKTIDNDIPYCDRTFGLVTAVEKARDVVVQAHTEAKAAVRGIGLVKLMGREAGFIACGATIASQEVNFTLIPEVPFELHGERGLLAALRRRMADRHHAVIAVAEGAGQSFFADLPVSYDASGNKKHHDIGPYLKQEIRRYFQEMNEGVDIKYIDPSYIIRSAPANSEDRLLCNQLARNAAHAAMAGKTDLLVCAKNGTYMHVPIMMAVAEKQKVDPRGELWASVLASTGQSLYFG
jgi:6-phosphofructokinase 1